MVPYGTLQGLGALKAPAPLENPDKQPRGAADEALTPSRAPWRRVDPLPRSARRE